MKLTAFALRLCNFKKLCTILTDKIFERLRLDKAIRLIKEPVITIFSTTAHRAAINYLFAVVGISEPILQRVPNVCNKMIHQLMYLFLVYHTCEEGRFSSTFSPQIRILIE